jgi:thioredoxin-like negative regulator of GroEL
MASKKSAPKKATKKASATRSATRTASVGSGAAERTKYFTASWCPPCQLVHRMLAKHPELAARLEILDVDEHRKIADRYDIESIPTFVHPDGRRRSGAMTARELRAFLDG